MRRRSGAGPTPVTYNRYLQHMQSLGIPFFHTPGNHDDVVHSLSMKATRHRQQWLNLANGALFLLNSAQPQRIDGKIADGQLEQLGKLLEQLKEPLCALPAITIPLRWSRPWIDQHKLKNSSDLLETIHRKYQKPMLWSCPPRLY